MIDFEFTEEQRTIRETLRRFFAKECPREFIQEIEEKEEFPHALYQKFAQLGMLGVAVPEQYGGSGGTAIDFALLSEEVGRMGGSVSMALLGSLLFGAMPILEYGSQAQKDTLLPRVVQGEIKLAFALTEPEVGSDAAAVSTRGELRGNQFMINGHKIFCTGALEADYIITVVRTDPNLPKREGLSIILVPTNSAGLTIRPQKKLGHKAVHACALFYDDVPVPRENLLGALNTGWRHLAATLEMEKISIAAQAVGAAAQVSEMAVSYAKERVQFGRPIGKFQAISHMLAEMATEVEGARWLVYRAAWLKAKNLSCRKEASMAKYYATEVAMRNAWKGMQVMGGYGYMMEYDMQRYFREAKHAEIGGGTTQIQKNIIAKELGL